MYKKDLTLNNQQLMMCHETKKKKKEQSKAKLCISSYQE